jgi:hypothetical protein
MEPEKSKAKTLKKRAFKVKRKNTGWVRKPVVGGSILNWW